MKVLLLLSLLFILSGCSREASMTDAQYARLTARFRLLSEHFHKSPDSLLIYSAALYQSEGVTENQVKAFVREKEKNPGDWEKTQQLILEELKKMDPLGKQLKEPRTP